MKPTRSCYVIAAWGGPRRMPDHPDMVKNGSLYLREHVRRALSYRRSFNHLVIAAPRGYGFYPGYEEYLKELESTPEKNGVTIEVFRRENIGFSYGSFNDAYGKYRTYFDYYFFAEDDYLPDVPGFDQTLIDMIEPHPTWAFVCGLVWTAYGAHPPHASVFLGVLRSEALEKLWVKDEYLAKFSRCTPYYEAERLGQLGISLDLMKAGYEIHDWTDRFSTPFLRGTDVEIHGHQGLPPMYILAQTHVYGSAR